MDMIRPDGRAESDGSGGRAATPTAGSVYRRDIDGLRCIAVSSVVFYHAGLWPLTSGYVGVDIFFVISGFLIGGILNREIRSGSFSFAAFYARRARRILPALIAVTLSVLLASTLIMGARELHTAGISAATALLGVSNIYFWWSTNYFAPASHFNPFLMTWSLGVEEQFYVVFPIILLLLDRLRQRVTFAVLAGLSVLSFIVSVWITIHYPSMAFYLLPMRAWELGAGALLAILCQHRDVLRQRAAQEVAGWAGLALVIASCVIFNDSTPFPGFAAALPVMGTLALLSARRSWVNQRLLSASPMVAIGLVSYSWYLWHAPLMALTRLMSFGKTGTLLLSIMGLVSLGCAYLSWRFVERPFRHSALPDSKVLRRYGMALAATLALPLLFVAAKGIPQRLGPHGQAVERTLAEGQMNPCRISYGVVTPSNAAPCLGSRPGADRGAVLLGDSHASAFGPALLKIAADQQVNLLQFEKSSCAPLLGATYAMLSQPAHADECAAYNRTVFERVSRDKTVKTVILAGFWSSGTRAGSVETRLVPTDGPPVDDANVLLKRALTDTVQRYVAAGKKVIVLADVPLLQFDPGQEVVGDLLPVRDTIRNWLGAPKDVANGRAAIRWVRPRTPADAAVRDAARSIPGVTFIDPAHQLCDRTSCAYGDGLPYYIDFQHLSKPGALRALTNIDL